MQPLTIKLQLGLARLLMAGVLLYGAACSQGSYAQSFPASIACNESGIFKPNSGLGQSVNDGDLTITIDTLAPQGTVLQDWKEIGNKSLYCYIWRQGTTSNPIPANTYQPTLELGGNLRLSSATHLAFEFLYQGQVYQCQNPGQCSIPMPQKNPLGCPAYTTNCPVFRYDVPSVKYRILKQTPSGASGTFDLPSKRTLLYLKWPSLGSMTSPAPPNLGPGGYSWGVIKNLGTQLFDCPISVAVDPPTVAFRTVKPAEAGSIEQSLDGPKKFTVTALAKCRPNTGLQAIFSAASSSKLSPDELSLIPRNNDSVGVRIQAENTAWSTVRISPSIVDGNNDSALNTYKTPITLNVPANFRAYLYRQKDQLQIGEFEAGLRVDVYYP